MLDCFQQEDDSVKHKLTFGPITGDRYSCQNLSVFVDGEEIGDFYREDCMQYFAASGTLEGFFGGEMFEDAPLVKLKHEMRRTFRDMEISRCGNERCKSPQTAENLSCAYCGAEMPKQECHPYKRMKISFHRIDSDLIEVWNNAGDGWQYHIGNVYKRDAVWFVEGWIAKYRMFSAVTGTTGYWCHLRDIKDNLRDNAYIYNKEVNA